MKIEILGTGCAKCDLLERSVRSAADKLGIAYELAHVKDIREFAKRGVMFTPALVVDGKVVAAGKVPPESEIARLLAVDSR
ncbi:MAG: TM0996/MTH895 family glutaredoxin-like protein [Phycisphaerae bacterium]|nr:MAG: thioredoxin family protein [Planctomycetota bacterium]KAB2939909.1 MAG: thioredoxin family protein [Phycisphaerae bacterium]MBE7455132.1 TM0996/MTH895 family glutaredoxin-like protein [Planctomycetia bacterium]MCL4720224.1 TM0996/MTH895 family glutaredoxin-like protein [Phycisphaerae bacterium]MCQ3922533.1 thioredoxin family protein [Planctomycetota bacterium]